MKREPPTEGELQFLKGIILLMLFSAAVALTLARVSGEKSFFTSCAVGCFITAALRHS